MAVIKPFRALRFTKRAGDISELVCPPYDIINEEQRLEYLNRNPYNIVRLELPRESGNPYEAAGGILRDWLDKEILARDEQESLYIYEEIFTAYGKRRSVKGVTCRVRLEELDAGIILPHEETLSKAKADRFELMCHTGCNFSSVYSLYFDSDSGIFKIIEELSAGKPDIEINREDVTHRLWAVPVRPETEKITKLMADKKLYIADGHHRYETALNYRRHLIRQGVSVDENHPANYIMMTLVNMENNGLVVFPTHRIIRGLADFDGEKLLASCGEYFEISGCEAGRMETELERKAQENKKAFAFYQNKTANILTLKDHEVMAKLLPGKTGAYRNLDVSILHTLVLERLLGIDNENMSNQKNLDYTRDTAEAIAEVDAKNANLAVIINPTKVSEIADVAGHSEKMPQKSTYFYPKLITGLTFSYLSRE